MGNACNACGRIFGDTKEAPSSTFQPAKNRSCTDILFLLLFIASFGGMLAVILVATGKDATPERIYHGVNMQGQTCGQGDLSSKPYNAWVAMPNVVEADDCDDCFFIKTCLSDCSETSGPNKAPEMVDSYKSDDFGYFCIPDTDTFIDGTMEFTYSGDFASVDQNAGRAIGDLWTVWPLLLGSAAVALLFAFLYNFLSETFAGVLVAFTLIIVTAGGVLASYTLIKAGKDARDSGTATNRSDAMLGVGITGAILTTIFVLVIIALRERIRIAIEVVKEANRCVHDMWSLVVFPLVPMFLGLGYVVFFIVVTLYIFAVWITEHQELPSYITNKISGDPALQAAYAPLLNTTSGAYNYQYYTWDDSMQSSFAFVFFHLLWTTQFVVYFTYMVMAGAVANWYFSPMDANEKRIVGSNPGELSHTPITDSCARTCRFHIGTVALAALIIAIVQFIRTVVKYIEKKATEANGGKLNWLARAVFCLIHCCLACLQCCLDKINKNALVWTAIWGDSFGTAACSSFRLLWGNLARTGAMSVISYFLMFLGKLLIAIATTGFAGIFIHFHYRDEVSSPVVPMVIVFIIAYMVGALFMSVFEVAMDTIFLCFLIDEKLHASTGTMCASKALRALVDSEEMKKENSAFAQREHEIEQRRLQQLGMEGPNNTGVIVSAPAHQ